MQSATDISDDSPLGMNDLCQEYYEEAQLVQIFGILAGVVISVVNIINAIVSKKMGKFRRYKTLSEESLSVMI